MLSYISMVDNDKKRRKQTIILQKKMLDYVDENFESMNSFQFISQIYNARQS